MRMIISISALAFAGAAVAQAPQLGTLDTDRDGSISRFEASAIPGLVGQFSTLDANGNGALEGAEFARFEATGGGTGPGADTTGIPGGTITPPPPMGTSPAPGSVVPPPTGSTNAPTGSTPAPTGSTTPPAR